MAIFLSVIAIIICIATIVFFVLQIRKKWQNIWAIIFSLCSSIAILSTAIYFVTGFNDGRENTGLTQQILHETFTWNALGFSSLAILIGIFLLLFFSTKKQQINSTQNTTSNNVNSKVGLWLAFCPPIFGTMAWYIIRKEKKDTQNIVNHKPRTLDQQRYFMKSQALAELHNKDKNTKKYLHIALSIGTVGAILFAFGVMFDIMALTIIGCIGLIGYAMVGLMFFGSLFVSFLNRKNDIQNDGNAYLVSNYCIKCGTESEIIDIKFLRTYTTTRHERVHEAHTPKLSQMDEVIDTRKEWVTGSSATSNNGHWKIHYTIKRTHYEHDVTRKCKQTEIECGYEWTRKEDLLEPHGQGKPQVINIENVEQLHATTIVNNPKPLPHIFCVHCGGKNKGESLKCEHCGAGLLKPT